MHTVQAGCIRVCRGPAVLFEAQEANADDWGPQRRSTAAMTYGCQCDHCGSTARPFCADRHKVLCRKCRDKAVDDYLAEHLPQEITLCAYGRQGRWGNSTRVEKMSDSKLLEYNMRLRKLQVHNMALEHAGQSLHESLEAQLVEDVRRYLDMKSIPLGDDIHSSEYRRAEKLLVRQRGIMRGTARALLLWRTVYRNDDSGGVQEIEHEFVAKVSRETST